MQPNSCAVQKVKNDMVPSREKGYSPPIDPSAPDQPSTSEQNRLPLELTDVMTRALRFGGLSALSGGVVGGFSGILLSRTPVLFATATSIQWGVLGTTFWGTRVALLSRYPTPTNQNKSLSTTIAASLAGATGGSLLGRKKVLPGFLAFGAIGYLGQWMYEAMDRGKIGAENEKKNWMRSKWVPWKALTDEEYEAILREKLLRIDAEIALLDESLERLKNQQKSVPSGYGTSERKA
ncbi:beta-ketoacyl synthase protein [Rutstroemia sp. NJR-2017a BBW]|nr:beta-ketoacyl synthase protein [Rutstroemia sp. NJR-2017a BBW]